MTCLQYLCNLGSALVLSQAERTSISISIGFLRKNLSSWEHASDVEDTLIFGSYSRDTILPRWADENSDVDLMVIFKGNDLTPQTHLNWLKGFAQTYYSRSEIHQSNPTIVLKLNHIKFEITPANRLIYGIEKGFQIPAPASGYTQWMNTYPVQLNARLTFANQRYSYLLKPLIRILKYANARMGKPYSSYEIEEHVLRQSFFGCNNVEDMFYHAVSNLAVPYTMAEYKKQTINSFKNNVAYIKDLKNRGYNVLAIQKLQNLLPC